jgi:hypothetical protein
MMQKWGPRIPDYQKAGMEWLHSKEVMAKNAHEMKIAQTAEGKRLVKEAMETYHAAEVMFKNATMGFQKNGDWVEKVENKDLANFLKELYDVKVALVNILKHKDWVAEDQRLGMAVLQSKETQKLWHMFLKDMGVKTCEELQMKLMNMAMKLKEKAMKCPVAKKLRGQVMKMLKHAKETREIFDMPSQQEIHQWVVKNKIDMSFPPMI